MTYISRRMIQRSNDVNRIAHFQVVSPDAVCKILGQIKRLARKHHKMAIASCNGYGVVRGQVYYHGTIDDYAKRTYGQSVKTAYTVPGDEETIFDRESDRIREKLITLGNKLGLYLEFQGDPRGQTVKVFYKSVFVSLE